MIPTSYFFKDLYQDHWGDPTNPHAVEVPTPHTPTPRNGEPLFSLVTLTSTLRQRFTRRAVVNACPNSACA